MLSSVIQRREGQIFFICFPTHYSRRKKMVSVRVILIETLLKKHTTVIKMRSICWVVKYLWIESGNGKGYVFSKVFTYAHSTGLGKIMSTHV